MLHVYPHATLSVLDTNFRITKIVSVLLPSISNVCTRQIMLNSRSFSGDIAINHMYTYAPTPKYDTYGACKAIIEIYFVFEYLTFSCPFIVANISGVMDLPSVVVFTSSEQLYIIIVFLITIVSYHVYAH